MMQEADLYLYWQHYARTQSCFENSGHQVRVLHPGRLKSERGPDFQSARFELDGVIYQGDVELHCRAKDWYRHQHHLDAAYANVILHLICAGHEKPEKVISRISGQEILTLGLPVPDVPVQSFHPARRCRPGKVLRKILLQRMQNLAIHRFELKIQQFISAGAACSDRQIFHENLMRVLGYPGNCDAFQILAQRLDYSWFMLWKQRFGLNFLDLFAIFAGQASFLKLNGVDDYCDSLIRRHRFYQPYLNSVPLDENQWLFARVRPSNHPHFRLAGWAWLAGAGGDSPLESFQEMLIQRLETQILLRELTHFFTLPCPEYWRSHYALMRHTQGHGHKSFFGIARIMEILINVILPFFAFQAKKSGSHGFYQYLQDIYLSLPISVSYAGLENRLPFLSDLRKLWPSQALMQAAISLESMYCLSGECRKCPLGRVSEKSR